MADGAPAATTGRPPRPPRTYSVRPVHRAIQVLRCVGASPVPLSLRRISAMVGMPKSTVFRYLWTLSADGLITHDAEHDVYEVDPAILSLLPLDGKAARLRKIALPHMTALHARFGGLLRLSVADGAETICIETIGTAPAARRTQTRQPIYATAAGRSILAFLDGELRSRIFSTRDAVARVALENDLAAIRDKGFAFDRGEHLQSVAVPVLTPSGAPIASLSLDTPITGADVQCAQASAAALTNAGASIAATFRFRSL